MRLDALLRAHGFMRVERPPQLWEAVNVANVTVPAPEPGDTGGPAAGDYVAVTVRGEVDWDADATWSIEHPWALPWLEDLTRRLAPAGARFAYVRKLTPVGSVTVFLPRLVELPNAGPGPDSGSRPAAARRARRA